MECVESLISYTRNTSYQAPTSTLAGFEVFYRADTFQLQTKSLIVGVTMSLLLDTASANITVDNYQYMVMVDNGGPINSDPFTSGDIRNPTIDTTSASTVIYHNNFNGTDAEKFQVQTSSAKFPKDQGKVYNDNKWISIYLTKQVNNDPAQPTFFFITTLFYIPIK